MKNYTKHLNLGVLFDEVMDTDRDIPYWKRIYWDFIGTHFNQIISEETEDKNNLLM